MPVNLMIILSVPCAFYQVPFASFLIHKVNQLRVQQHQSDLSCSVHQAKGRPFSFIYLVCIRCFRCFHGLYLIIIKNTSLQFGPFNLQASNRNPARIGCSLIYLSNLKREAVIERHYCYLEYSDGTRRRAARSSELYSVVTIMTFNHGFAF